MLQSGIHRLHSNYDLPFDKQEMLFLRIFLFLLFSALSFVFIFALLGMAHSQMGRERNSTPRQFSVCISIFRHLRLYQREPSLHRHNRVSPHYQYQQKITENGSEGIALLTKVYL